MTAHRTEIPLPGWTRVVAVLLVVVVVLAAFILSFTILRDLAAQGGIPTEVAWLWPVIVDGTMTAATFVLFVQRSNAPQRRLNLPLGVLLVFGGASLIGNVTHILMEPTGLHWALAAFIGVVPPLGLILTVELLVTLLSRSQASSKERDQPDQPAEGAAVDTATAPAEHVTAVAESVAPVATPAMAVADVNDNADDSVATTKEDDATPSATVATPDEDDAEDDVTVADAANVDAGDNDAIGDDAPLDQAEPERSIASADDQQPAALRAVEMDERPARASAQPAAPVSKSDRIEWIVAQVEAGDEPKPEEVVERFEISARTAQRDLQDARKKHPDAFAA